MKRFGTFVIFLILISIWIGSEYFIALYRALEKWSSFGAHNPEIAGSNPVRASKNLNAGSSVLNLDVGPFKRDRYLLRIVGKKPGAVTGFKMTATADEMFFKKKAQIISGLFLLLILSSCGSAHHLRRAERLKKRMDEQIDKAIEKGAQVKRDTVFKEIQVFVPEVRTDTIFQDVQIGDTVTITKEKLQIKYVRLPGDSVFIEGECESDTIYVKTEVAVNTNIEAKQNYNFGDILKWFLIAFILGGLVRHFWPLIRRLVMMV